MRPLARAGGWLLAHRLPRRVLTVPGVVLVLLAIVTTVPLWLLLAAAVSPWLPGRWRPLRLLCFVLLWLLLEVTALAALGWLWLVNRGRVHTPAATAAHYRLLGWLTGHLVAAAHRLFGIRLALDGAALPTPPGDAERGGARPLLVLSRHAGPGDSLLLVHELLAVYDREPRIVLKDALQLDPTVDVLVNRLPSRFISPHPPPGSGVADQVGQLAASMDGDDALVIFPEGGNFTERRRLRAIAKLESGGRSAHAAAARRMRHLVAPRPGGVLAALDAAPRADVVFVGHTGLEELDSVGDLWRGLPLDSEVRARFWTVPAGEVPTGRAARIAWLYDWWTYLDTWISGRRSNTEENLSDRA